MTITIKVYEVKDGDARIKRTPPRSLLIAKGFLPSGQDFIHSRIYEGHDPATQSKAVHEIRRWLADNRPEWNLIIDGPYLRKAAA